MGKSTQKRNSYNTEVIKKIAEKYSVTPRYIRQCITGDRTGIFPDKMKAEYKTISDELERTLNQSINSDL
jgi:uncharacterized protein YdeI (YjbR/CyaY-like superfamily)